MQVRWRLAARSLSQEREIPNLPLGELVSGVPPELHLDAETENGYAGDRALARELFGAECHGLAVAVRDGVVEDEGGSVLR